MDINLSVALVTRNRPEWLRKCLMSWRAQGSQPMEIIVSDDSDDVHQDEVKSIVQEFGAEWIAGPRRGLYANRNRAFNHCQGTHILSADDDHTHPPGFVNSALRSVASDPDAIWTMGERSPEDPDIVISHPSELRSSGLIGPPENLERSAAIACGSTIYPKRVFEENLRCDETYPFGGLWYLWGQELRASGFRILRVPDTFVLHHAESSLTRRGDTRWMQSQLECHLYVCAVNYLYFSRRSVAGLRTAYAATKFASVGGKNHENNVRVRLTLRQVARALKRASRYESSSQLSRTASPANPSKKEQSDRFATRLARVPKQPGPLVHIEASGNNPEGHATAPRVLFLHANIPCYLAEPLLHGLRRVLGLSCVDVPRYDSLYETLHPAMRERLRGHGFTLYGLLADDPKLIPERYLWKKDLESWDLIVIANIWEQGDLFHELRRRVPPEKLVLLDGYDTPAVFPFSMRFGLRSFRCAFRGSAYFKRELATGGEAWGLSRFLPPRILRSIPFPALTYPLGFSIPAEKISNIEYDKKTKDFARHIVDEEVAARVEGSFYSGIDSNQYPFDSEEEYYADLKDTRFGITLRRGGWDCLRHYELAANGCILCFRDLDQKPSLSSPHGLNSSNSISYANADELMRIIAGLSDDDRRRLSQASTDWAKSNTTVRRAKEFLATCGQHISFRTPQENCDSE